jgi:hypothetical protein
MTYYLFISDNENILTHIFSFVNTIF